MTDQSLHGRVALVTGAGSGLGVVLAKDLARRGAAVAVHYHSSFDAAKQVVREIEKEGGRAVAVKADLTDQAQADLLVAKVGGTLGELDLLVLNATGYPDVQRGPAVKHTPTQLADNMRAHYLTSMTPVHAALPGMVERGSGSVVYISDTFLRRTTLMGLGHALPKAGVESAMKHFAQELGRSGVRFNTVIAGAVRSPALERALSDESVKAHVEKFMTEIPLGRVAEPEDVANAVALLAGDQLGYVTGAFLPVTGGLLLI
ncbi:SDR family NAD(P)-dependent oxidoreductase [Streptomyces sp. NPDC003032]